MNEQLLKTCKNCARAYFFSWPSPNLAMYLIQHRVAVVFVGDAVDRVATCGLDNES